MNLCPSLLKSDPSSAASILPSPLESSIVNARCRSAASVFREYLSCKLHETTYISEAFILWTTQDVEAPCMEPTLAPALAIQDSD